MPFGLMNAEDIFQRVMDIYFKGLIGQRIVVYLDDVAVYSKEMGRPSELSKIDF
jgi:hypothetical protein